MGTLTGSKIMISNSGATHIGAAIHLNQAGYRASDEKIALITKEVQTFKVYESSGRLVYEGTVAARHTDTRGLPLVDKNSGDRLWEADFTSITESGTYYIQSGSEKSPLFSIGNQVYCALAKAILKLFYYQRCGGTGISTEYAGLFAHCPCHTGKAVYFDASDPVYGGVTADVSGGWHDAGDYGRYITPAAKSVVDLMMAAKLFPHILSLNFGGPDRMLQEIRYELEWMLKMQNPVNGGVYHKVTTQNHANMDELPENDRAQLYLSPVSAQAAGSFAAAMAHASRLYSQLDPVFAANCIDAAEKAWKWLSSNPQAVEYKDPSFFRTGAYGDSISHDERCWAAAELYSATGSVEYLQYLQYLNESPLPGHGFGWVNNSSYAMVAYLLSDNAEKSSVFCKKVKKDFLKEADRIVTVAKGDGYGISLEQYSWGSNMDAANIAMGLLLAYKIQPDPDYKKTAIDHFHYLLGRNTNGISYVTGFGEFAARNPHHRPSMALGSAVPGMLTGGPFAGIMHLKRDPASRRFSKGTPPAKCYADLAASFSTNEICIYWNSPLAFVLAFLLTQPD